MPLFKSYAADYGKNNSMSQHQEGRTMDAHHGCSEVQKAQNSTVTSDQLIIQKEEPGKEESPRFYTIPNTTDTIRAIQRREPYEGTVKFMHFKMIRVSIT